MYMYSDTILSKIPPPELHIMLGVTNKIFDELNRKWEENKAYKWAEERSIARAHYHGGCLDGNSCKTLLSKADQLYDALPRHLGKFADALRAFNKVRIACLILGPTVQPRNTVISECIYGSRNQCNHQSSFCLDSRAVLLHQKAKRPRHFLGAGQSVHADFGSVYANYKCPENHPEYAPRLRSAVVKYNSLHV
jgi:hypothetical protein